MDKRKEVKTVYGNELDTDALENAGICVLCTGNCQCQKYLDMLAKFQETWDTRLDHIDNVETYIELTAPDAGPIISALHPAGPNAREFAKLAIDKIFCMNGINPAQLYWESPFVLANKKTVCYDSA